MRFKDLIQHIMGLFFLDKVLQPKEQKLELKQEPQENVIINATTTTYWGHFVFAENRNGLDLQRKLLKRSETRETDNSIITIVKKYFCGNMPY